MKFSIITPSYNCGRFIADTIESVISQRGDFEIEYIIMDSLSTDETRSIVGKYRDMLESNIYPIRCRKVSLLWESRQDAGMYDAINRGFSIATGDVQAWLNADDIYLPGAFQRVKDVFAAFPVVRWLKGITSYIDSHSSICQIGECYAYHQPWIANGVYGRDGYFIQQDSVFWRRELWSENQGVDASLRVAGDYSLWIKFSKTDSLVSVAAYLSAFRRHDRQLSTDVLRYVAEMEKISPLRRVYSPFCRVFFKILARLPILAGNILYRLLFPRHNLPIVTFSSCGRPRLQKSFGYIYKEG